MSVYFVYRSFDHGPTGKFLKRFDDKTVLAWFQRNWDDLAIEDREQSDELLQEAVGCEGWFLWNPFHFAFENGVSRPSTGKALLELLGQCFDDEALRGSPHCLQMFTEEDGEGGALYFFDDHFLNRSGGLAAYLLHEDWRLPSGIGDGKFTATEPTIDLQPGGTGAGTTYFVPLERNSKYPLDDVAPAYRINGIRLPELAQHLCPFRLTSNDAYGAPRRLQQLPALLLGDVKLVNPTEATFLKAVQANPSESTHWSAWADWRQEQELEPPGIELLRRSFERFARFPGNLQDDLPLAGDLTKCRGRLREMEKEHRDKLRTKLHSLIHVENHMAQMCVDGSHSDEPYFGQWVFFDDLWASAHPDLANAILRFSARWDVLTPD